MTDRDYPWRAFTTPEDLAECLSKIAIAIDYANFKQEVCVRDSHERARIYSKVWSDCR
ncbi:MAG: hypothetical protein ACRD6W_10795 [Nitrososphaerales archaeon]